MAETLVLQVFRPPPAGKATIYNTSAIFCHTSNPPSQHPHYLLFFKFCQPFVKKGNRAIRGGNVSNPLVIIQISTIAGNIAVSNSLV